MLSEANLRQHVTGALPTILFNWREGNARGEQGCLQHPVPVSLAQCLLILTNAVLADDSSWEERPRRREMGADGLKCGRKRRAVTQKQLNPPPSSVRSHL